MGAEDDYKMLTAFPWYLDQRAEMCAEIDWLRALVADLANMLPYEDDPAESCRFCGEFRFVTDSRSTWRTDHEPRCVWVRAAGSGCVGEPGDAT